MASGVEVNIQHVMAPSLEGLKRAKNLTGRMAWPFIESFLRACVPSLHLHSSVTEAVQQAIALTHSYLMITVVPTHFINSLTEVKIDCVTLTTFIYQSSCLF